MEMGTEAAEAEATGQRQRSRGTQFSRPWGRGVSARHCRSGNGLSPLVTQCQALVIPLCPLVGGNKSFTVCRQGPQLWAESSLSTLPLL